MLLNENVTTFVVKVFMDCMALGTRSKCPVIKRESTILPELTNASDLSSTTLYLCVASLGLKVYRLSRRDLIEPSR